MQKNEYAPIMFLNRRSAAQPLALLVCLLLSVAAWSQIAYVTDGSGQEILAVSSTGGVSTVASLNKKFGTPLQVRVGGDGLLYVITSTNILRMTQNGPQTVFAAPKNGGPTGFTGIRFDSQGNLYANTSAGVYVIAGVVQATTSFASPSHLTTASCSPAGDLAFTAFGDLLIACNGTTGAVSGTLFECLAPSLPNSCTGNSLTAVANITGPVVGLAVDSLGDIITSSGTTVNITGPICNPAPPNPSPCTGPIDFSPDVPAYLEAVPYPAGSSPSCNTASPSILVSTALSGKNGKVWSLDTVQPGTQTSACPSVASLGKPSAPLANLNTNVPAVGLAALGTLHTLTKSVPPTDPVTKTNLPSDFHYGNASLELLPTSAITTKVDGSPCNLSMTKKQLSVSAIAGRLAGQNPPVTAITFDGEQSWVTGFDGAYDPNCLVDSTAKTHIGISGFYGATNPHIVLIPDDGSAVTVDELPFVYPIAPLQGTMGDLLIHNTTPPGVFTITATTIIVANVGFTNNAPAGGYLFCGFLSPFIDNPAPKPSAKKQNIVNSGQSASFKFQLGVTSCSDLVSDQVAQTIASETGGTGFSVAEFANSSGTAFQPTNGDGKGNSVQPPTFKYDSTGHQFIYTLDTTGYCSGSYEATANGASFHPHTLIFTVISGPC
jgi:hypothetical protein